MSMPNPRRHSVFASLAGAPCDVEEVRNTVIEDDGDIVRGLGFVALYAAYLEEQVQNLLVMLAIVEPYDETKQRWQVSKKLKHVIKLIDRLNTEDFPNLTKDLGTCLELFEDRNLLIHGRIYGNFDRPDTLKSGRPNIPDREVESAELYKLANEFEAFRAAVYGPMIFKLPRAIALYLVVPEKVRKRFQAG